ncbi:hypothetical protein FRC08_008361 [Ceratobasidium sp. 394]|nr:hypothetical protein FRC08_008361 [Ceratobasidium sp. 394]
MDYDSNSGDNSGGDSAPEFSDDNEKTLCTCGCKERLSVRQKNRHLKKARERARKDLPNLDEPELMDVDAGLQGDFAGAQEVNNWEERVGDDLFDHANDVFMNKPPDNTLSDALSSTGSWYEVGTPPPTPPRLLPTSLMTRFRLTKTDIITSQRKTTVSMIVGMPRIAKMNGMKWVRT